ncbi:unnamed protein product [Chilo suppressalis]|uniref:Uncharacterized protein n=1 Tax=Chilo suppressalis TaxID=168631 RepID=A0ABN8B483_CHISP|nr:unnamed protein product [Chilo suppressalis]
MSYSRSLTLNEIIEELDKDEDQPIPDIITILPPENCNADVTDEDSGDENLVSMHNLPGSQLRAQAEVYFGELSSDSDSDDELSLAQLAKRRRLQEDEIGTPPQDSPQSVSSLFPSSSGSQTTVVPKNKLYCTGHTTCN